jgi:anti-sigma B factor antagonist/stage II sporulation protein AA (anti-sigma F factor antagonist)
MVVGLNIQDQDVNGTKVVRLEGRLDAVSSTILEKKLKQIAESGKHHVALDFAKLEYLSSAGMRLLLSETKKFKSLQGSFCLFAIHENVMEIIKMAGFERILSIYPHEKEALTAAASHKH